MPHVFHFEDEDVRALRFMLGGDLGGVDPVHRARLDDIREMLPTETQIQEQLAALAKAQAAIEAPIPVEDHVALADVIEAHGDPTEEDAPKGKARRK